MSIDALNFNEANLNNQSPVEDHEVQSGDFNGRKAIDIKGVNEVVAKELTAPDLNVLVIKDIADKTVTVAESIFKTLGLITLTCTLLGCFSLNPLGGFMSGVALSLITSPFVISYNIASKIVS
jgi:hypothetical protein